MSVYDRTPPGTDPLVVTVVDEAFSAYYCGADGHCVGDERALHNVVKQLSDVLTAARTVAASAAMSPEVDVLRTALERSSAL